MFDERIIGCFIPENRPEFQKASELQCFRGCRICV